MHAPDHFCSPTPLYRNGVYISYYYNIIMISTCNCSLLRLEQFCLIVTSELRSATCQENVVKNCLVCKELTMPQLYVNITLQGIVSLSSALRHDLQFPVIYCNFWISSQGLIVCISDFINVKCFKQYGPAVFQSQM